MDKGIISTNIVNYTSSNLDLQEAFNNIHTFTSFEYPGEVLIKVELAEITELTDTIEHPKVYYYKGYLGKIN